MLQIHFDLSKFEGVEIVTVQDVHIGNPLCLESEFKKIVDYIKEEPFDPKMARICLLNGDLTESATRNSVGNLFEMTMTPSVQVATIIKYLKPLTEKTEKYPQGKILSYCAGNHDNARYKDTGISASESIAVGLELDDRYSVDGCYSFIALKRRSNKDIQHITVYNTHLSGGGITAGAKANKIQRVSSGIIADIICGAHFHSPMVFKEDVFFPTTNGKCTLKRKTITHVIGNSFLAYGDYAQRAGMRPTTIATPRIFVRQYVAENERKQIQRYFTTEVLL